MITINKNSSNYVTVTLQEKTTITNPVYLFRFVCDLTGKEIVFTSTNLSTNTLRYDRFLIVEDVIGNQDLYNGVINLKDTGDYTYYVYEIASSSPQDLDYNNATSEVERGKMICFDSTETTTSSFSIDDVIDNYTFKE